MSSTLEYIDDWNLFDEVVREFKDPQVDVSKFFCYGGECESSDGDRLLRTLIVDRESGDLYRLSFNVSWCPEDHKEWLWQVTTMENIEMISRAKHLQKERTKNSWDRFLTSME